MLEPRADFWDIEFPAMHKAEEALARLLMECSFCQRREVVYLNEMELEIVRDAKMRGAGVPALRFAFDLGGGATEAKMEEALPVAERGGGAGDAAEKPGAGEGTGAGVYPAARISGGSRGLRGLVERRDQFPEPESLSGRDTAGSGGAVHAGCGAIFVPIRIVFSQPIRRARDCSGMGRCTCGRRSDLRGSCRVWTGKISTQRLKAVFW